MEEYSRQKDQLIQKLKVKEKLVLHSVNWAETHEVEAEEWRESSMKAERGHEVRPDHSRSQRSD